MLPDISEKNGRQQAEWESRAAVASLTAMIGIICRAEHFQPSAVTTRRVKPITSGRPVGVLDALGCIVNDCPCGLVAGRSRRRPRPPPTNPAAAAAAAAARLLRLTNRVGGSRPDAV